MDLSSNNLIDFGIIILIVAFISIYFLFPNMLIDKTNSFNDSNEKTSRYLNPNDSRKIDINRYVAEKDLKNKICPDNYFIFGINEDNSVVCRPDQIGKDTDTTIFSILPSDCSTNQYAYGVNSNNTLKCRTDQTSSMQDSNVWTENFLDNNDALVNDLNLNNNNIINVNDLNATNIFIQTGDLNFFVYDKNIIMQTANGLISFYPDLNKSCVGSDPNVSVCFWVVCSGGDCNGVFGMG